jgi:hypothetical protein
MADIVGGGPPVNDAERAAIAQLRDHAPDDWLVLHNIEIPVRGDMHEVDLVVVTGHSVCIIDVKGTRGRIEVSGRSWYPSNRVPLSGGQAARPCQGVEGRAGTAASGAEPDLGGRAGGADRR